MPSANSDFWCEGIESDGGMPVSRGITSEAIQPQASPKTKPSPTSCSTKRHHTKCPESTLSAARNASTAGSARPSLSPDSRFSEWRTRRGTRGLVTMLDVSTGSVGASSAPSSNDSVQERPINRRAAAATITVVSGIASTSLRSGRCHARCSISPSTSRPSRNRITISAANARSSTKPERARKSIQSQPAVAQQEAGEHEQRRQREHRAARQPGGERPQHQQQAQNRDCRLEAWASTASLACPPRDLPFPADRLLSAAAIGVYLATDPAKLRQRRGSVMAAKDRINKAGEAARAAQRNRYLQRLLEDEELRGSLLTAYGAARSAYGRMTNGKPATEALFEDKKLQRELREAADALRERLELAARARQASAQGRHRALAAAAGRRRRTRDRAQRGPALEGARPAVRGRGGVRLQLDHGSGRARARERAGRLATIRTQG